MLIRRNCYFHFFLSNFSKTNVPTLLSSQLSPSYNWIARALLEAHCSLRMHPYLTLRLVLSGVMVPDGTQWVSCWRKNRWGMCTYSNVVMSNLPSNSLLSSWPGLMLQQFTKIVQSNPLLSWLFTLKRFGYILLIKCKATHYCADYSL